MLYNFVGLFFCLFGFFFTKCCGLWRCIIQTHILADIGGFRPEWCISAINRA